MTTTALLTAEMEAKLERVAFHLSQRAAAGPSASLGAGLAVIDLLQVAAMLGIGLVDAERTRHLVDERVYGGALFRGHRWQALAEAREPVPMILFCPACGEQHVDRPEPDKGWTNPPHRSHLCHACGAIWRPADIATVGVAALMTRGRLDGTFPAAVNAATLAFAEESK